MVKSKILSILAGVAMITGATSCNSSDGPENQNYTAMVFVTNQGLVGDKYAFSYYPVNSNQAITLYTKSTTPELAGYQVGQRIVIAFEIGYDEVLKDGMEVELYASSKLSASGNVEVEEIPEDWNNSAGLYLQSLMQSGPYLDVMALAPVTGVEFKILAKPETLSYPYPELYIIYKPTTGNSVNNGQFLASFNMSAIWDQPHVKGVRVNLNNSNMASQGMISIDKK